MTLENRNNRLTLKGVAVNPALLLAAVLLIALALRLFLLPMRWINPDEGAHLLDARLLLEGQMPVADFGSRQPFYVVVVALFLKLFGVSHWAGRLMPLTASLGVGVMLYLFGKRWRDATVGLVAAAVYVLLPLVLVWSTIVKTEQLAIFLGVAGLYALITARERVLPLLLAGVLSSLAFYVRQPTLYLPLAAVVFLAWRRKNAARNIALYIAGYLLVCGAVVLSYLPSMSFQEMLFSQLNPLHLIWNRALHTFGMLPEQYRIVDDAGFRLLDQSMDYTLASWHHALSVCLFIIVGAATMFRRRPSDDKDREFRMLLTLWVGFSFLLYLYQTASRGFYTQYFTEALPPLILLASVSLADLAREAKRSGVVLAAAAFVLFYGLYILQRIFWQVRPGMAGYFVLSLGLAAVAYAILFKPETKFMKQALWLLALMLLAGGAAVVFKRMGLHDLTRFLLVSALVGVAVRGTGKETAWPADGHRFLLLAGFFFAALYSGLLLGPRYEAIWANSTLKKVVQFLDEHGDKSDDLLSGGMIWTFESGLQPYLNVPHPTEFYKHRYAGFETTFAKNPPQFIIIDGYTHRKFAKYWTFIKESIEINYDRVARFDGSKYPVDIFQIMPQRRGESGFIARRGEAR